MAADPFVAWVIAGLKQKGKSQSGLARHLGIDASQANRIVQGKRKIQTSELGPIADYLGVEPPDIEIARNTSGMATGFLVGTVEAGAYREVDPFDDGNPYDEDRVVSVPADPQYPQARVLVFDVAGDSMNALRPRPIFPGDRVIALSYEDIASQVPMRDGMTVILERTRDGGQTREWSIKQVELYEDRVEFHPRSTSLRHKPIIVRRDLHADEGTSIEVVAVVRRIMNDVPLS